jgi:hypothetical protein
MRHLITRTAAPLAALALLVCTSFLFIGESYAQCRSCLQAVKDTNHRLCQPDPCPPDCITFAFLNNCESCITDIRMDSKTNEPITSCCAAILSPSHTQWNITQRGAYGIEYSAVNPSTDCIHPGQFLQITVCGVHSGDVFYLVWTPLDPPCSSPQDEMITIP